MEVIPYAGWQRCARLSNGTVELVVTLEVGPRILRYAPVGGASPLQQAAEHLGQTGGDKWLSYGGHRLWHAPEIHPRTYYPDNHPVAAEQDGLTLRLRPAVESSNGIRKELDLTLAATGSEVVIEHRLVNEGPWPVTLAPWAITVMAPGGFAVVPQEPFRPHPEALLPVRPMALWAYTGMGDARFHWGDQAVIIAQDPAAAAPLKVGFGNTLGWLAYLLDGSLFVKRFDWQPGATYPDLGSNCEVYTDAAILELESLGPLTTVEPGGQVSHTERWWLRTGIAIACELAAVEAALPPLLEG